MQTARVGAEAAFLCAVVALPLQWYPPIPLAGAQLSDFGFAFAALALVASRPRVGQLPRFDLAAFAVFLVGVAASAAVNAGSYLKLAGHAELVVIAVTAALLARDDESAARIRLALVAAAVLAALLGLAGAVLYYAGHPTQLLNHYGDLVPGHYPRIRGTCVRVNMLATVLATGGILLLAVPAVARGRGGSSRPADELPRDLRAALLAILCIAMLFTFSRTWLTVAAGVGAVLVARRPSRARWVALAVFAAAMVALLLVSARYEIVLDPTHPFDASISQAPATRWIHWGDALATVREHALFGVGPGRPATFDGWSAHLTWLNLWAVLGILPLVAFAAIAVRAMTAARACSGSGAARLVTGPAIALAVILLDSLGRDVEDMRHLWILVGLLLAARAGALTRR